MTHAFRPARAVRRETRTVVPALAGLLIAVASCAQAPQSDAPSGLEADLAANTVLSDSAISGAPSPFGSYLAGRFARNERDLGAAADFLLRALDIDPDNHDLRAQAFGALVAAGRIEESLPLAEDLVAVDPSAPWPGLVLALAHSPRVLILDEPTGTLDPLMQERVHARLRGLAAAGHTVFFSSHTLSEVEPLCDRVAIVREGRIVIRPYLIISPA